MRIPPIWNIATIGHELPRNFAPLSDQTGGVKETQGQIGDLDVKMQATKSAEPKDSKRQHNDLDNRYGKIGISAVAAALRHLREQQTVGEYRIPFDRD